MDAPPTYKKFQPNSFDENHIIDSHEYVFSAEMEYLMPYTRLKPKASTGMQLKNVKKSDQPDAVNLTTTSSVVSSKTIQKHVLNQPFKQLKSSSAVEISPSKMSKKHLKVAQDQLKKLTKINIHLHGKYNNCMSFYSIL